MNKIPLLTPEEQLIADSVDVKGYRILLKAVELPEKTKAGIILTESYKKLEKRSYNVGKVIKMGHMSFQPLEKFCGQAYCSVGDWVHFSSYEREEVYINDYLCYYINDERIYSVISNIEMIIKELR